MSTTRGRNSACDDGADDQAEGDDQDRFEEADEGADEDIDLVVVVVRDFEEHFVEIAGFFADVDHVGDDGVDDAGGAEGSAKGEPSRMALWTCWRAFSKIMLPTVSRVMVRASRMGTPAARRVPRVRVKRATAVLWKMRPRMGSLSLSASAAYRPGGFGGEFEQEEGGEGGGEDHEPAVLMGDEVGGVDEVDGDCGEISFEVLEDFLEARDDENHDAQDDEGGEGDHDGGIDQGSGDAAFEALGFFHEFGEAAEGSRRARRRIRPRGPC